MHFMRQTQTDSNFGEALRAIRRMKGYTQDQLAELSGVSRRAIVHYENHAKRPTFDKIKSLADALGVSDEELSGQKRSKKKDEVSYKIMKKVRIIEQLPTRDQNAIFRLINSLAAKNKLKGKL
jgi:transcriptional regulator with XRE-family HTH domain